MNPGMFFREVLESHQFRRSDTAICETTHVFEYIIFTSDNTRLLDIEQGGKKRRLGRYLMETSAARLSSICSLQMLLLLGRKTNAAAVEAAKGQV